MVAGGATRAQDPAYRPTPPHLPAHLPEVRETVGMGGAPWRPTKAQLEAARDRTIPDVLAPGLAVVFVGINPGRYSGAVGHHFARPGNRFWKALHRSGFTDREWSPFEDASLVSVGIGITNLADRTTASAAELGTDELRAGRERLERKIAATAPAVVAILGITAYRAAFDRPKAVLGRQAERLGGAETWVLPNPSGLNAHHQLDDIVDRFTELRAAVGVR
jgi:double-stranded uracil-DNA glycosylase